MLRRSGLSTEVLRDIWNLVDIKEDGFLDADWFAVAMHLTMRTKRGQAVPEARRDETNPRRIQTPEIWTRLSPRPHPSLRPSPRPSPSLRPSPRPSPNAGAA